MLRKKDLMRHNGLRISGGWSRELSRGDNRPLYLLDGPARSDGHPADGNPQPDGAEPSASIVPLTLFYHLSS